MFSKKDTDDPVYRGKQIETLSVYIILSFIRISVNKND
jgi:hypothetical protein